jgi:hypothetical protein
MQKMNRNLDFLSRHFIAENRRKVPKIVIITLTPDHTCVKNVGVFHSKHCWFMQRKNNNIELIAVNRPKTPKIVIITYVGLRSHMKHIQKFSRGRCYDHNFLGFWPIFGEKIGIFLKKQCYI